jgi:prophage tail gpP-like protein
MSIKITPKLDGLVFAPVKAGGVKQQLEKSGRLPPVQLKVTPIDSRTSFIVDRFLSYEFSSSMIVPVDTFTFTYIPAPLARAYDQVKEGDIVQLFANGTLLSTGLIDEVNIEVDAQFGEKVTISGRDLLCQLEDQEAINPDSTKVHFNKVPISAVCQKLIENTRIPGFVVGNGVPQKPLAFVTEPGESKLSALQRHVESLNCLFYASPEGKLVVTKPDFAAEPKGRLVCAKERGSENNTFGMSVRYAASTVPNFVVPVWAGQETVVDKVAKRQGLRNRFAPVARLYRNKHFVYRTTTVSLPEGGSAQDSAGLNELELSLAGNALQIDAYAKRLMARENFKAVQVMTTVPGHYNERAEPYLPDANYRVLFDRGGIDKTLYLYGVRYSLGEDTGQRTDLELCERFTIVADTQVRGAS